MALKTFSLSTAMNGSQTMPDGKTVRVWGFTSGSGGGGGMSGGGGMGSGVTVPSPLIQVNEGDSVEVTLYNHSMMDHTIHLHGLDVDTQNDGVPHTSFAVPPMGSYTYKFVAKHAGTYLYHCHVDTVLHHQMGMYGPLIVMPADGSNRAWTGGPAFNLQKYWMLSEYDSVWHNSSPGSVNYSYYNPDYFLINGKADPDTQTDTKTAASFYLGQTLLIRLCNAGYLWQTVSLGGLSFQVIASDGRPLPAAETATSVTLAPGERYDLLVKPAAQGTYTARVDYLNWYGGAVRGSAHTTITVK